MPRKPKTNFSRKPVASAHYFFRFITEIDSLRAAAISVSLGRMCAGFGMWDCYPSQACTSVGWAMVNRPSRFTGIPCLAQVCAEAGLVPRNLAMAVQPLRASTGTGFLFAIFGQCTAPTPFIGHSGQYPVQRRVGQIPHDGVY
jgi:hypothetical protein